MTPMWSRVSVWRLGRSFFLVIVVIFAFFCKLETAFLGRISSAYAPFSFIIAVHYFLLMTGKRSTNDQKRLPEPRSVYSETGHEFMIVLYQARPPKWETFSQESGQRCPAWSLSRRWAAWRAASARGNCNQSEHWPNTRQSIRLAAQYASLSGSFDLSCLIGWCIPTSPMLPT